MEFSAFFVQQMIDQWYGSMIALKVSKETTSSWLEYFLDIFIKITGISVMVGHRKSLNQVTSVLWGTFGS